MIALVLQAVAQIPAEKPGTVFVAAAPRALSDAVVLGVIGLIGLLIGVIPTIATLWFGRQAARDAAAAAAAALIAAAEAAKQLKEKDDHLNRRLDGQDTSLKEIHTLGNDRATKQDATAEADRKLAESNAVLMSQMATTIQRLETQLGNQAPATIAAAVKAVVPSTPVSDEPVEVAIVAMPTGTPKRRAADG